MKKNRILAMMMAGALSLSLLAGCGDSGSSATPAPKETAPGATTPANQEPATAPTGAAFKLGGTGPLTGGAAIYGNAAKNGAQIAVDEINAMGGAVQFELNYQDDEHDAEKAVYAYSNLKDWGMQLFLGSVTSTPGVATSAEANGDRVFYLTPSASSTDVLGGVVNPLTNSVDVPRKDNVFQMCFMDPNQGSASAQYIVDKDLGTKVAVIYKNDDVYSIGIYNSFKTKAAELGLSIVSETTFTESSQNDFTVQLTEAKKAGADLVFLPMYYQPASLILSQAKGMDYAPKFFGVDGMDGILTMDGFDPTLAEGVMLLTPFNADSDDAATKSFVEKYQAQYGEIPNQFAADAYDCVYAYKAALEAIDATPDMDAATLCDQLIATFTGSGFSIDGLTGASMTWDESGAVSKSPKGMVIQDGAYVGMD